MERNRREYPLLSACGLNCGLCPRFHTDGSSKCPGCGGEGFLEKRPKCGVLSCGERHGGIEYCYLCGEYPCTKYDGIECVDSFITHRNMKENFVKIKETGMKAYRDELDEKVAILESLLKDYNDGRRKNFYCIAVNLLELKDVRQVMGQIGKAIRPGEPIKEKAAAAVRLFQAMAEERGIELKLNKKR